MNKILILISFFIITISCAPQHEPSPVVAHKYGGPLDKYYMAEGVGSFVRYHNCIVWDQKTGLEWVAGPERETDYVFAEQWANNLNHDGDNWRLPSIEELRTLYNVTTAWSGQAKIPTLFYLIGDWDWIWSKDTNDQNRPLYLNFRSGKVITSHPKMSCVRGRALAVRIKKEAS